MFFQKKDKQPKEFIISTYLISEFASPPYCVPCEVQNQLKELYFISCKNPEAAIIQLEKLRKKYPNIPKILNNLIAAYQNAHKIDVAFTLLEELYRNFPDYIFGRCGIAQLFIESGRIEYVPTIFNDTFDLNVLYPERKMFHHSEVFAFCGVISKYYWRSGDIEMAKAYCEAAEQTCDEGNLKVFQQLKNEIDDATKKEAEKTHSKFSFWEQQSTPKKINIVYID